MRSLSTLFYLASLALAATARAELKLPAIIGDNMVLQQKQSNPIWGWDAPNTQVTVKFAGQTKSAKADEKGRWQVKLDPVPANAQPAVISIQGSSAKELKNVLVGEVWLCSGQSNMGFSVNRTWDADLEMAMAKYPNIRLISVPNVGTQEIQDDFKGQWEACTPVSVGGFSAVGFHFGRLLHEALGVPVGLIDNAWGGSSAEAWVRRDVLAKDPRFAALMERWKQTEATFTQEAFDKQMEAHKTRLAEWNKTRREALKAGQPAPAGNPPRPPQNALTGQHRPGNLYAGCLHPVIGYGIKGAVWYQGESNAARAFEYRALFPLMIQHWREEWKQGDFSFYWVQLADFKQETPEPGESDWAELREAQTLTLKLPNTGEAVITDLGEANDIHPKNKQDVAERLARWALVKDYGFKMPYSSPRFKEMKIEGNKAILTFDHADGGLRTVDVDAAKGFAICGEDRKWVWAPAVKILPENNQGMRIPRGNQIEVSSPAVPKPVAVRYSWADNPIGNVFTAGGLPLTPFRTDDFPMITDPKNPSGSEAAAAKRQAMLRQLQGRRARDQKKLQQLQSKTQPKP
jgi:sialate O-acetylesterase